MKSVAASEAATTFAPEAATMGRKKTRRKPLGTIWEVPDALWQRIEPILKEFWPRKGTGRPPVHSRRTLNGIILRLRSGCQWDQPPARYGPKSTVHGWSQRWAEGGVLEKIWAVLVAERDGLGGVEREWLAADGMPGKARFGGEKVGKNPTDRGKPGTKMRRVTDGADGPLGAAIAGANVPDFKILEATIEAIVIERPDPEEVERHPCLDAGFDNPGGRAALEEGGYVGHIRPSGNGKPGDRRPGRRKPRRWVVERALGWLSKCRGILVRYDEKDVNDLGLIQLACGLYWYRRLQRMCMCNAIQSHA